MAHPAEALRFNGDAQGGGDVRGDMAILLVEQYFEFARDLASSYLVISPS